jgi:hypothetical protein
MHESERNRLRKRLRALLLAVQDMDDVKHAGRTAEKEPDARTLRLLATALVVSYMRPFTHSTLATLREFEPTDEPDAALHGWLAELRDQVYAHTDKDAYRYASFGIVDENLTEDDWWGYVTSSRPFPPSVIPDVVALANRLQSAFEAEARRVWISLGRPQGDWF